jgi:glycosyltransferase involved in cell wall biosynthesis
MKLSVVIPTFNKVALLKQTLAALARQDPGPDRAWEVVVVNDGSSDGTADFLKAAAEPADSNLVIVDPPGNVGRARARNLGARTARGTWILFLDDDIVAPEGLLSAHLDLLESHPGCGTIGYAVTDPTLVDAPHFHYLDSRGVAGLASGSAPGKFFVTQNAAVPRQAFLDSGAFDEDFSAYGFEDMEVAFRMEDKAGVKFIALTAPVPVHVHHHTLEEYLAKKVECGRNSLPHLALIHPDRIREMKLHYVVDAPGQPGLSGAEKLVRVFLDSGLGGIIPRLLASWPSGQGYDPMWRGLYFQFMNLTILSCFRKGLKEGKGMN